MKRIRTVVPLLPGRVPARGVRSGPATVEIALVLPLHGPAGMFGPSCELCAELAVEELNAEHGILGHKIRLHLIDGAGPPHQVASRVGLLARAGRIDAVVGWHLSALRQVLAPRLAGIVPYVYTALYEGGERTPGVFLTGETPAAQLLPSMRWLAAERGARRWSIVGNDYVWPRRTARLTRPYATACGGVICGERFVPLGTRDFQRVLDALELERPDAVVMLLVGGDAVAFNRAFARRGLDRSIIRLSTLVDENTLLGSGADATSDLWATAAYFETLVTADSLDFGARYVRRFGIPAPPLNSIGESCYEGIKLLAALAHRSGTLDPHRLAARSDGTSYGGPRGEVHLRAGHLSQSIYLARANGLEFDVVATV